jgi:hypothetical protein
MIFTILSMHAALAYCQIFFTLHALRSTIIARNVSSFNCLNASGFRDSRAIEGAQSLGRR